MCVYIVKGISSCTCHLELSHGAGVGTVGRQKGVPVSRRSAGQTIATSVGVTPKCGLAGEFSQDPLNSVLGIIVVCPDSESFLHKTSARILTLDLIAS